MDGQAARRISTSEQELARLPAGELQVLVEGLTVWSVSSNSPACQSPDGPCLFLVALHGEGTDGNEANLERGRRRPD
jgi:hypothetical protein